MEKIDCIGHIQSHWPVIGNSLASLEEIRYFSEEESPLVGFALLPTLFVTLEKVVKFRLNSIKDCEGQDIYQYSFGKAVRLLADHGILSGDQHAALEQMREMRNHLFHDMYESGGFVIDGKISMASELDTHILIYDSISGMLFELMEYLLNESNFPDAEVI